MSNFITVLVLLMALLATGLGIVYSKHQSRKMFVELQALLVDRDNLEIEWGQLQLEQSALATEVAVDGAARTRLDMIIPGPAGVVHVTR